MTFEVIGITTNVTVTGVKINKNVTTINVGNNETLSATITPTNATNKNVTWSTSDPAIAMVDQNGIVKAIKAGTATIKVTTQDGSMTASCIVTVKIAPIVNVTKVILNKSTTSIDVGDIETLTATITPSSATNQNITWKSSKTSVATVDSSGKVTGVSAGAAVITVTTVDGKKTASCNVTVKNIPIIFVPGTLGCFIANDYNTMVDWYEEHKNDHGAPILARTKFYNGKKSVPTGRDTKTINNSYKLSIVNGKVCYIGILDGTFDTLFAKFRSMGYVKEKNLFLFGYDTLETSISTNALNLRTYIDYVLKQTGAKKVNIIAHSQGDLVTRQYIETQNGYAVSKFIMLAPPNTGVSKLGGAYFKGDPEAGLYDSEGLKYMVYYRKKLKEPVSNQDIMTWVGNSATPIVNQPTAKALLDMLPTMTFQKQTYTNIFLNNLNSQKGINNLMSIGKSNLYVIYGSNKNTINGYDKNGNPTTSKGDDTVTIDSLSFLNPYIPLANIYTVAKGSHGDICYNKDVLSYIEKVIKSK